MKLESDNTCERFETEWDIVVSAAWHESEIDNSRIK